MTCPIGPAIVNLNLRALTLPGYGEASIASRLSVKFGDPRLWEPCNNCRVRDDVSPRTIERLCPGGSGLGAADRGARPPDTRCSSGFDADCTSQCATFVQRLHT